MTRLGLLFGALALALLVGALALRTPALLAEDAPPEAFSAARAMIDVREMARAPRPIGSAEHARVRDYLNGRMADLGLAPQEQAGPLSPAAERRMQAMGRDPALAGHQAINLVGVLPGRDPAGRAVLLMAHYDSVPGSPGAADDAAGVAAILETVRALKARGADHRPLVVLLTDAEELNLDGARVFFSEHPLRDRVGAVINLEARGGGGRAAMFETGPGNAETIALFARAARRAQGGPASNSLAAFVYGLMPNGTDFTIARNRGVAGINLAFIDRPAQYHSPASTPDALDPGSLQHIGALTLETAEALMRAEALPAATRDRVYADILGRFVLGHAPEAGWGLLALAALLWALAAWGAVRAAGLTAIDGVRGAVEGVWFVSTAMVAAHAVRALGGPLSSRAASPEAYYTLLRRLPWMEAGVALAVLAVALAVLAGRGLVGRRVMAGLVFAMALVAIGIGGFSPVALGAALVAVGLSLFGPPAPRTVWGAWLGLIALVAVLATAAQAAAPQAAFLLVWTVLLAAIAAAVAAVTGARLARPQALAAPAAALALGGAWLVGLGHFAWLGVGMDLPGVMALMGLLVLMLARPLAPAGGAGLAPARGLMIAAAAGLLLAGGASAAARWAEPAPPPSETHIP